MSGQPITAAPWVPLTYGLDKALGAGVTLLENGTDPLDPQARWRASQGFTLEGESCTSSTYQDDICLTTSDDLREDIDNFPGLYAYEDGYPFVVGAGVRCSTMGAPELSAFYDAADRTLELTQWSQIAHELMTGDASDNFTHPRRALQTDSLDLGAAADVTAAISLLEANMAATYVAGPYLIHVPPSAIAYLKGENLITGQGGRWYTALGSLIVVDNAYLGNGRAADPDGGGNNVPASGHVWIYGSGPVTVRLDRTVIHPEPLPVNAVTYQTNDIIVRAQKVAGVSYLCEAFRVDMALVDP